MDSDLNQEYFPGGDGRPTGRPDFISLIAVDRNNDGNFEDEDEVLFTASSPDDPTPLITRASTAITIPEDFPSGSVYTLAVRVCDDGQWTHQCHDSYDSVDCSLCTTKTIPIWVSN